MQPLLDDIPFPLPLSAYPSQLPGGLLAVLRARIEAEPFNAIATAIFFLAVAHTFFAARFIDASHRLPRPWAQIYRSPLPDQPTPPPATGGRPVAAPVASWPVNQMKTRLQSLGLLDRALRAATDDELAAIATRAKLTVV